MVIKKMVIFLFLLILFMNKNLNGQITTDCGKQKGCFLEPPNCRNENCNYIVKWSKKMADSLDMEVIVRVKAPLNINSVWVGIAFSDTPKMSNSSAVMCFSSSILQDKNVQSYYLIGHKVPIVFLKSNPTYGLMNTNLIIRNEFLICSFTRNQSSLDYPLYADTLRNNYYLLNAYGTIDNQSGLKKHYMTATLSDLKINFNSNNIYESPFFKNSNDTIRH